MACSQTSRHDWVKHERQADACQQLAQDRRPVSTPRRLARFDPSGSSFCALSLLLIRG